MSRVGARTTHLPPGQKAVAVPGPRGARDPAARDGRVAAPGLHRSLLCPGPAAGDMDFSIMLSSVSGLIGNPDQGNYTAGNTYQDAMGFTEQLKREGEITSLWPQDRKFDHRIEVREEEAAGRRQEGQDQPAAGRGPRHRLGRAGGGKRAEGEAGQGHGERCRGH